MTRVRRPLRRFLLASLALAAMFGPGAPAGCAGAGFDSISSIDGLRVLAVQADKPYANPGDVVTFQMTYDDGYVNPAQPNAGPRPIEILWLGGCIDPEGDEYTGCYTQIAAELEHPGTGADVGAGLTFSITLPEDIISQRPKPPSGDPYYGIAYVFFAVCAGTIKPVPAGAGGAGGAGVAGGGAGGAGEVGSFPLGCFDAAGNQLGADSFVPGYTQVYAFADGRTNHNPVVLGLGISGAEIDAGVEIDEIDAGDAGAETDAGDEVDAGPPVAGTPALPEVERCDVSEEDRRAPAGCGRKNALTACVSYDLDVIVPRDVAEVDPSGKQADGQPLHEAVWVDYFADQGDINSTVALVSDATLGIQEGYDTLWTPPPTPGPAKLWAVVHDSRGGVTPFERTVWVK
jgi:hypothetical protein